MHFTRQSAFPTGSIIICEDGLIVGQRPLLDWRGAQNRVRLRVSLRGRISHGFR